MIFFLLVSMIGNAFCDDNTPALTRQNMRECIYKAIEGSRPDDTFCNTSSARHSDGPDVRRRIGRSSSTARSGTGSASRSSRSSPFFIDTCSSDDPVYPNPEDFDPLRFGPGTVPSHSGYSDDILAEFEKCYNEIVLNGIRRDCFEPPTPRYTAVSLEILCCGGVRVDDPLRSYEPSFAPSFAPSFKPTTQSNPTVSPTKKGKRRKQMKKKRKKRKLEKKLLLQQQQEEEEEQQQQQQQPQEEQEQVLGVRSLREDCFDREDRIILDLCKPSYNNIQGHCNISQVRTLPPTEVRPTSRPTSTPLHPVGGSSGSSSITGHSLSPLGE